MEGRFTETDQIQKTFKKLLTSSDGLPSFRLRAEQMQGAKIIENFIQREQKESDCIKAKPFGHALNDVRHHGAIIESLRPELDG